MTNPSYFVEDVIRWEGCVPWLYCDVLGYVTIGVGNLVKTAQDADRIPLYWPAGSALSTDEKRTEWQKVAAAYNKARPVSAQAYAGLSKARMRKEDVVALVTRRIGNEFLPGIRKLCPGFDDFPLAAQSALVDIAYNCGMGGLAKFSKMLAACNTENWKRAAETCHRKTSREARNQWAHDKFMEAAHARRT